MNLEIDKKKARVADRALEFVKKNQCVGLGTGSTTRFFIEKLAQRNTLENLNLACVASSFDSSLLSQKLGLRLLPIEGVDSIDISIDGADEIDPVQNLIKGGGAAHTREKLIHAMSKRFIVIADASKLVKRLGEKNYVPVEFLPVSYSYILKKLEALGGIDFKLRIAQNKSGPIVTDNGNWIVDVHFDIVNPLELEIRINEITGVVENGIFAKIRPKKEDCIIE